MSIETNGTLLTQEIAKYIKEHSSVGFISVSLDGAIPKTHDSFRGVKGSFEKACQAVEYLAEVGYDPQIIMSVHAGNVDEIEAEVHLAEELGAGSLKFNLVQAAGRGEGMEKRNELLNISQLIEIGQWVENELQNHVNIRLFYSWPMAFHSLRRLRSGNAGTCGIFGILGILASGQYAMCGIGVDIPELVYGQLGVDRLEDVWVNNAMLNKLRKVLPEDLEGVCGNCILRQQCLGNCVADNYHQSHRLTAPFWFCQQADEIGLFPKSRLNYS